MTPASRTYLYSNGRIHQEGEFTISPADRGLLYGDGLFETMRIYSGGVHLLGRHLKRLREGCALLEIPLPGDEELAVAIEHVIEQSGATGAALRLTITRGPSDGIEPPSAPTPTLLFTWRPLLHSGSGSEAEDLVILTARRMPPELGFALKSLNYLTSSVCRLELQRRGAREGLLLTAGGLVAEGSISNIFIVRDGALSTPSLDTGILPGITRARVLELAALAGIRTVEGDITVQMLVAADECFYTNSGRELVPVGRMEGSIIGSGGRGEMTRVLQEAYRREAPLVWG